MHKYQKKTGSYRKFWEGLKIKQVNFMLNRKTNIAKQLNFQTFCL